MMMELIMYGALALGLAALFKALIWLVAFIEETLSKGK